MAALFALGQVVQWDSPLRGFALTSRRMRHYSDTPQQPAFFQVEHDENVSQVTGLPYKWILEASWVVYQNIGSDPNSVPQRESNLIKDALTAALSLEDDVDDRVTLGGLVHHVYFDGRVFSDSGDLDGQGVIVMPIKILVP